MNMVWDNPSPRGLGWLLLGNPKMASKINKNMFFVYLMTLKACYNRNNHLVNLAGLPQTSVRDESTQPSGWVEYTLTLVWGNPALKRSVCSLNHHAFEGWVTPDQGGVGT